MFVRIGDAGLHLQLDAVLGLAVDRGLAHRRAGHVDHFRIHAGLHGVENVAAGEVDRGRGLPRQIDVGLVGGDHRVDDALHVAAGQDVRLHLGLRDMSSPARTGLDARVDDRGWR